MPSFSELLAFLTFYGLTPESLAPLVVVGYFFYTLLNKDLNKLENRTTDIEKSIVEIQGVLTNTFKLQFQQTIASKYGKAHSPIGLKDEYRPFITKPELDKQIEEMKPELIERLKRLEPQTGLDAQDYISDLVTSDEIGEYLDLTRYRQHLYESGKTSEDAAGILTLYLYETLIPELGIPELE